MRRGRVKLDFGGAAGPLGQQLPCGPEKRPVQKIMYEDGVFTIATYRASQLFES